MAYLRSRAPATWWRRVLPPSDRGELAAVRAMLLATYIAGSVLP